MPDVDIFVSGPDSVSVQAQDEVIEIQTTQEVVEVNPIIEPIEVHIDAGDIVTVNASSEQVEVTVPVVPSVQVLVGASVGGNIDDIHYAAVPLSGHRVVFYDSGSGSWVYADKDTPSHSDVQLGVLIGAIGAGQYGAARLTGIIEEPTWNWPAPCVLYLGNNGYITDIPPSSGFSAEIGRAITSTKIMVEPEMAIHLLPGD